MQVWCAVLGWYAEQRKHIQNEIRKYSDPPSDRLLPDNPPHMRCVPRLPQCAKQCVGGTDSSGIGAPALLPSMFLSWKSF